MYPEDVLPEFSGIVAVFYLVYMLVMLAISVAAYVFQSLSFYTIAKRRGIRSPWLAWLPVGSSWILGCISDQYQYVVKGKVKNKRKALLILELLMVVGAIGLVVLYVVAIVGMIAGGMGGEELEYMQTGAIGALLGALVTALAVSGMSIAAAVIQYIAMYDLYSSCDPKNNVIYLVLNIFVGITVPVLLFICRNKDLGMPPRKAEPAAEIPAQPAWEPAPPQEEPWDHPEED